MPSLNLAIARLNTGKNNFAIWVVKSSYPGGYPLRECVFSAELSQIWREWQQMFASDNRIDIPSGILSPTPHPSPSAANPLSTTQSKNPYSIRLMQSLGISLWRWVFDGAILGSLERSRGIAMGERTQLRFGLEIRDPGLIALPWEIMQREAGQSAISLSQDILFSRTTTEVEPLEQLRTEKALNILLVLGHDEKLDLAKEAVILQQALTQRNPVNGNTSYAPCTVKVLLQPTPQVLIQELETLAYNVFFYAGHGLPGPDGGLLFLGANMTLNGIELAQVLTRTKVKLGVFNACWGAQPAAVNRQAVPASSLAEVLIRHGVPAVLGMRDKIADEESHCFIAAFTEALRARKPIDQAVAVARQELLTVYKFNQPAWTLPVLYLHPDFDGVLIKNVEKNFEEVKTEIPNEQNTGSNVSIPTACLRSLALGGKAWPLRSGVTRIGRTTTDNDIVIPEQCISKRHAEIFCHNAINGSTSTRTYYLQDFSTYGTTWCLGPEGWQQIPRERVPLKSGMQLKFGSPRGEIWEFIIEE